MANILGIKLSRLREVSTCTPNFMSVSKRELELCLVVVVWGMPGSIAINIHVPAFAMNAAQSVLQWDESCKGICDYYKEQTCCVLYNYSSLWNSLLARERTVAGRRGSNSSLGSTLGGHLKQTKRTY